MSIFPHICAATRTFEVGTGSASIPVIFDDVRAGPWGGGALAAHFLLSSSLLLYCDISDEVS